MSEVIRSALETFVADAFDEAEDVRAIQMMERRIAKGKGRLCSHEEVWAEIDALEAKGALSN